MDYHDSRYDELHSAYFIKVREGIKSFQDELLKRVEVKHDLELIDGFNYRKKLLVMEKIEDFVYFIYSSMLKISVISSSKNIIFLFSYGEENIMKFIFNVNNETVTLSLDELLGEDYDFNFDFYDKCIIEQNIKFLKPIFNEISNSDFEISTSEVKDKLHHIYSFNGEPCFFEGNKIGYGMNNLAWNIEKDNKNIFAFKISQCAEIENDKNNSNSNNGTLKDVNDEELNKMREDFSQA